MSNKNPLVPQSADVFRYRSTEDHVVTGVPTEEQQFTNDQQLVEIDGVYRDSEGKLRYTGHQSWVSFSQLIVIEDVVNNA